MSLVVLAVATWSACTPAPTTGGTSGGTGSGGGGGEVTVIPGALVAPAVVRLPYVEVGATPYGTLSVEADGAVASFQVLVDGPFTVTGSTGALADGASRTLTVSYTGSAWTPADAVGTVTLRSASHDVTVRVGAVIGDPALPEGLVWSDDGYGLSTIAHLPSAPFPKAGGAWTDDSVYLWFPHGFSPGYGVVTHLHGHYEVLASMLPAKGLPAQFRKSGRNALFIVPQGPVNAASGDFGKLMDAGGHAALVRDAVALLYREGFVELPETGLQVLTSHSGGYRATAAIVDHGGLPIDSVNLFDSLYGELPTFEAHALDGGVLRSIHTATGGTRANNEAMLAALSGEGLTIGTTPQDADHTDVTIAPSSAAHAAVMASQDVYARWVEYSGLPAL